MATPATAASAASLATTVVRTTTVFFAISGPLKIEHFETKQEEPDRLQQCRHRHAAEYGGGLKIEAAAV